MQNGPCGWRLQSLPDGFAPTTLPVRAPRHRGATISGARGSCGEEVQSKLRFLEALTYFWLLMVSAQRRRATMGAGR
ncbi:hypothetical protein CGRA01v4_04289 [Colletotrichum graminicola]|uniref:Uncharacterized protein n=1 Tax=Colletotrichum graminicola (strain M1.001 / M2 / FGSC 10212) TaxID=645133 RepID=E3Q957_COLGM|nr:uncharacterized protein GLRG_01731 [Colletotrichum graminicola M1.001]EFQ27236.1 hypothetical protein GLRG_01731 [Colletotrichum graminicola M1.001]WDK13008.1 hypothetical protein CGRA01v4_04289 [Colletotrichum graminicola]